MRFSCLRKLILSHWLAKRHRRTSETYTKFLEVDPVGSVQADLLSVVHGRRSEIEAHVVERARLVLPRKLNQRLQRLDRVLGGKSKTISTYSAHTTVRATQSVLQRSPCGSGAENDFLKITSRDQMGTHVCGSLTRVRVPHGLQPAHDGLRILAEVFAQVQQQRVRRRLDTVTLVVIPGRDGAIILTHQAEVRSSPSLLLRVCQVGSARLP